MGVRGADITDAYRKAKMENEKSRMARADARRVAKLESALERARTILANMALENEGAIFRRWPIHHEPLRADARALLPEIDAVLRIK